MYFFVFIKNFITFNRLNFYQACGFEMNTNFSSSAANIFILCYEFSYILNTIKSFRLLRHIDGLKVWKTRFRY